MDNVSISDSTIIDTYKAITATEVTSSSDPGVITIKVTDRGGNGPNIRFTFHASGVKVDKGKTDSEVGLRMITIGGEPGIQVITHSKATIGGNPPKDKLNIEFAFPMYHSLLQAVKEVVVIHKVPIEQAVMYVLQNRSCITLIDSYTSIQQNMLPTKITSAIEAFIAMEGHLLGVYIPNGTKHLLHLNSGTKDMVGSAIYAPGDYIPFPSICLRKTSDDMYAVYYNKNIENTIKRFIVRKELADIPDKVIDQPTLLALLTKVLSTHLIYPLPHISHKDIPKALDSLGL